MKIHENLKGSFWQNSYIFLSFFNNFQDFGGVSATRRHRSRKGRGRVEEGSGIVQAVGGAPRPTPYQEKIIEHNDRHRT